MARTNLSATRLKPEVSELLTLEVLRREQVSPSFVRVTLGGGDAEKFVPMGFDQWFRLFIPVADGTLGRLPQKLDPLSYLRFLTISKATRPVLRNYTVRAYRADGPAAPRSTSTSWSTAPSPTAPRALPPPGPRPAPRATSSRSSTRASASTRPPASTPRPPRRRRDGPPRCRRDPRLARDRHGDRRGRDPRRRGPAGHGRAPGRRGPLGRARRPARRPGVGRARGRPGAPWSPTRRSTAGPSARQPCRSPSAGTGSPRRSQGEHHVLRLLEGRQGALTGRVACPATRRLRHAVARDRLEHPCDPVDAVQTVLVGPPASGKSTVGELLAEATGRPFVDADAASADFYAEVGWSVERLKERASEVGFAQGARRVGGGAGPGGRTPRRDLARSRPVPRGGALARDRRRALRTRGPRAVLGGPGGRAPPVGRPRRLLA